MSEQIKDGGSAGLAAAAARDLPDACGRDVSEAMQWALERAARDGVRAAVVIVEVNPNYAARAHERVAKALAKWQERRAERVHVWRLGCGRFALTIAPVGVGAHVRTLAERLTRSLDPRICPLLHRALPYAFWGVSLYPDDGFDAGILLARAQGSLDSNRATATRRRRLVLPRRRPAAGVLRPVAVR